MNDFMFNMIRSELEDVVGRDNVSVTESDKISHSVDYFWLSRMWADRGLRMPEGDFIVAPKDAKEVSAVLKRPFKMPNLTYKTSSVATTDKVGVKVLDSELCSRYMAGYVGNIKIEKSPKWMQKRLALMGIRAINNVVD